MKSTEAPVVVTQTFNKPLEVIWNAITVKDEMVQWFFDNIPAFKPKVGFKTQFNVQAPSRDFLHLWEVIKVKPLSKIVVNWKYENFKGDSLVTMSLDKLGNLTKLTLTARVVEDFDDSIPEFKRESCVAGWNYFIKERLSDYLEK